MREIKFRAWDKKRKKLLEVLEIKWISADKPYFSLLCYDYEEYEIADNCDSINCILMQYTGLKDRNSKEIYDGDILSTDGGKEDNGQVVFQGGAWQISTWNPDYHSYGIDGKGEEVWPVEWEEDLRLLDESPIWNCEIIGNIYENPELAEPK